MKAFQLILRIIATLALSGYAIFLTDLTIYWVNNDYSLFRIVISTEYLMFLIFILGYYYVWKNELISGVIIVFWHMLQWVFVHWVWEDAALTLVFGIPIGLIGISLLVYGILDKRSKIPGVE